MDLVTRDGQTVSVPDDKVGEAVASGQYGVPKGANVKVIGDTGQVGSLSADDAVKAFQAGTVKRLATNEEFHAAEVENKYGGVGGAGLATAAGLARGATVGLSDAAVTGVAGLAGGDAAKKSVAEHLSGAKEAHPYLSTGSEIAGMVAPAFLTDGASLGVEGAEGASLLGRAARIVSAPSRGVASLGEAAGGLVGRGLAGAAESGMAGKVLSRAAQLGAQGMVEGSLYGAGNEVSEAALGNVDLTAEKLIAGAKHGAIMGGVAGAALGGGSVLAEAAAQKIAAKLEPMMEHATSAGGIEEYLNKAAGENAFKAAGAMKKDYTQVTEKLGADGVARVGRTALEELPQASGKEFWKMNLEDMAEAAATARQKWGKKVGSLIDGLDEGAATGLTHVRPDGQRILERIDADVISKLKNNPFQEGVAAQLEGALGNFRARFGKAAEVAAAPAPSVFNGGASKLEHLDGDMAALLERGKHVAPDLTGFTEQAALSGGPESLGFKQLHDIRAGLDDMVYRNAKAGSMFTEELRHVRSIIEDELTIAGEAAAKDMGGSFAAEYKAAKGKYADLRTIQDMADNSLAREGANRFVSPSDYGMGFLGAALHTSGGPAGIAVGLISGSVNHFLRKQGRQIMASGLDKASTLFSAQRMAAEVDSKIADAVETFVSSGAKPASSTPSAAMAYLKGNKAEALAKKAEQVRNFATNPAMAADKVTASLGGIGNHAPELAGAISTKATQAAAYLESKSPPMGRSGSLQPQFDKLTVSNQEALKWARHAAVVHDPLSVLDDLQQHRLTFEAVDTLKNTSPELFGQIREQMMDKVAHATKPLSYAQRVQLGLLFDFPADPSLQPQFMTSIQSTYAPANGNAAGGKEGKGAASAPHVKAAPLGLLKSIATGSQRGMTR